jgi:addiction module HigA family antidote
MIRSIRHKGLKRLHQDDDPRGVIADHAEELRDILARLFRQCIEPLGLSITGAAAALGVTRTTLSELVNGKRGISPEMAVRISKVFGGSAESWLAQQAHYDLAQVRADRIKLKRLQPALARTVLKDDFHRKLLARRGRIPKDVDLEF